MSSPSWISVKDRLPPMELKDEKEVLLGNRILPTYKESEPVPVLLANGSRGMDRLLCRSDDALPPFWYLYDSRVLYWYELPPNPSELTL